MEEPKEKINPGRLLITIGIVIITAAVVGGTVWYVMNQKAKTDKANADKQVSDLQKQVTDLQKTQIITTTTTPATTSTSSDSGTTTSYTNSTTNVSFSYPKDYTLVDQSSTKIGSPGDSSLYYHSDFTKATLYLTKDGVNIFVNILESTDMDKVLSSMGDTSNSKTVVKYGDYSGYVATAYGTGYISKNIVDTIVGKKYSIAIMAPDPSYSTMLDSIIRSVKFN
ncbi:MAG: hypothetical protein WCP14_02135 [bacterium]